MRCPACGLAGTRTRFASRGRVRVPHRRFVEAVRIMRVEETARRAACAGALVVAAAGLPGPALVAAPADSFILAGSLHTHNLAGLAILIGLTVFATILSLMHLHERSRWTRREREQAAALGALRGAHDRAEMLLNAERQVIVTWAGLGEPVIEGDVSLAFDSVRSAANTA